ncbi:MAG TPA: patatin-like phospholipase family protein [Clostridia bacterium]|nr:patatin-like phospholipase family protein [Clostridia bacterium]
MGTEEGGINATPADEGLVHNRGLIGEKRASGAYRKWGLALGGGGLKGAAHVGVLKVLEREGLVPDVLSGTSAGAVVASLYCSGLSAADIERRILDLIGSDPEGLGEVWEANGLFSSPRDRLSFVIGSRFPKPFIRAVFSIKGVMSGERVEKTLDRVLERKTFNEVTRPLAVEAVDLHTAELVAFVTPGSIREDLKTRDLVYIYDAKLSEAVRASISVPVLFVPKEYKGRHLVDGGVKDNVPVGILRQMGANVVVAVDLGKPGPSGEYDNALSILIRSLEMTGREMTLIKLQVAADLVMTPDVGGVGHLEVGRIPELIKKGEETCLEALPRIREMVYMTHRV